MKSLIAPVKELGYSKIYLDFINNSGSTNKFYTATSINDVADSVCRLNYNREAITEILARQNKNYGSAEATFQNIEKIKGKNAVCLFSGQQAGLLGGPLLVIIKALAIVKAAKNYSKELNRPVIPIFWIAGDDHDYEEVNHLWLIDRASELNKICYEPIPDVINPTAQINFDNSNELQKVKDTIKDCLGETDYTPELYQLLDDCYQTDDTYVTSFGKLMARLMKKTGLVLFSPGDASAKQLSVEFF